MWKTYLNQFQEAENKYVKIYLAIQFKLVGIRYSEDFYRAIFLSFLRSDCEVKIENK